ncbi:MAG: globin [bacterium]|nr:globin [bacterium]
MRFRIDDDNIYEKLGLDKLKELSTEFYRRVAEDTDPEFQHIFDRDLSEAVQNQFEFFAQRFGGPPLYTQRKGHPALRGRHAGFAITKRAAEIWLGHMREAMSAVGIPQDIYERLDEFFVSTAEFLVNVDEDGEKLH